MKQPASPRTYRIAVARSARKQLLTIPSHDRQKVQAAIDDLIHTPRPSGVKKLKGQENYRIRVGNYRILYAIFDNVLLVEIVKVGQRGNFYDE